MPATAPNAEDLAALARDLAGVMDWRAKVQELQLPEATARALRVQIVRVRNFHLARLGVVNAAKRSRRRRG